MSSTATDLTREHYQRPEVREIVTKYALPGDGNWRALNGDFVRWYKYAHDGGARLINAIEDYGELVNVYRTFYQTLNLFEPGLMPIIRQKDEIDSDNPLGTPAETVAYTLGVDIDKGNGCEIETPEVKEAVEQAAQFLVNFLRDHGIHESVWVLFSGGGAYVLIHHELCRPNGNEPEARREFFGLLTDRYNRLIAHVSGEFFKTHPEYIGKVKYDALNNSKRIFKCILSIHKKKPYAVTPLNRNNIKIDFDRARVPLSIEMIEEARAWYSTYDRAERDHLFVVLDTFKDIEKEAQKRGAGWFGEVWRSSFKVDQKYFPPCIKHIIDTPNPGEGKTRFTAVLSTFLYQMGWEEEEAWSLVSAISDRNGVSDASHIFDTSFGVISCPSCQTIQTDAAGYPHLGLKGLGACYPTEECDLRPGDYATAYAIGDMRRIAKENESKADGHTVIDALATLMQHEEEILEDPDFDRWEWRLLKPKARAAIKTSSMNAESEKKAHKVLEKYEKFLSRFGIEYSDLYPIPRVAKAKKEEFDWKVKALAKKVLRRADPMLYVADSCGRVVLGADSAFKKLICCISAQNVNQTAGMHPKLSGDSSGGKTITVYSFAHHLPAEMVIKGSMSSKAGYYHQDGDRVFRILDDYQAGNEELDTVIKQTSSEFHQPYSHRTVKDQQAIVLTIGKEQTWAITSVDGSQDIQVLNRQLPINVDDSVELTKKVNDKTVDRYAKGEQQQPIDKRVKVCRAIFQILRDTGYIDVRIPFGDRIEWLDTSNRRNPSLFMDLLVSITAMNRFQREKDAEGYYLATVADFNAAKKLFSDKDAEELVKRLTAKERELINLLITNSAGLTRDEIAEKMKVAPQRITQILNGQKGYGGLRQKIQIAETKTSESTRTGNKETDDTRKTIHRTIYSLKEYDRFTGFDAVVRLKPEPDNPGKQGKQEVSKEVSNQTTTSNEEVSKVSKKEREREKREGLPGVSEGFSRENEKNAYLLTSEAQHSEEPCLPHAYPILTVLTTEEQTRAKEEHFRKGVEEHTGKPPLICAKCGEDLTGHGQITKGEKVYCAKVGCGYPAREVAKAN